MIAHPITFNGATEWEVERIVRHRISCGNRYFLVKFVGFDMSEAIWLSENG